MIKILLITLILTLTACNNYYEIHQAVEYNAQDEKCIYTHIQKKNISTLTNYTVYFDRYAISTVTEEDSLYKIFKETYNKANEVKKLYESRIK